MKLNTLRCCGNERFSCLAVLCRPGRSPRAKKFFALLTVAFVVLVTQTICCKQLAFTYLENILKYEDLTKENKHSNNSEEIMGNKEE